MTVDTPESGTRGAHEEWEFALSCGCTAWLQALDGNGNTLGWVNGTTGALAATVSTDAFGARQQATNTGGVPADILAWAFSTKPVDPDTGHVRYQLRTYAPSTGRWLSRDPIEEEGGLNVYGFVGNGPVGTWDDLGMNPLRYVNPFF